MGLIMCLRIKQVLVILQAFNSDGTRVVENCSGLFAEKIKDLVLTLFIVTLYNFLQQRKRSQICLPRKGATSHSAN